MADVSGELFNKAKNLAHGIYQQTKTPIDSDINDSRQSLFSHVKDMAEQMGLEGFVGLGWKVVGWPSLPGNNFGITAGYGWHNGLRLYLAETVSRRPDVGSISNLNMSSVISSVQAMVFSDLRMNYGVDEHVGKQVAIWRKTGGPVLLYTLTTNQATTFTVSPGDDLLADGVEEGDHYCILCSTPVAADRDDLVVVNVFTDEVSSLEDPSISHMIGGEYEGERRLKIRTVVEVIEGIDPVHPTASLPADYTDFIGNLHSYIALAVIHRTKAMASIVTVDITDLRIPFYPLYDYLPLLGGTMQGDIDMDDNKITGDTGEIDFATGLAELNGVNLLNTDGDKTVLLTSLPNPGVSPVVPEVGQIRKRSDGTLARMQGMYPSVVDDFTTKEYVDEVIDSHTHPEYLEKDAAGLASREDISALCEAMYGGGHTHLAQDEYVDWDHGLSEAFLHVQVQYMPTTGDFADMWVDAIGVIDWAIVDEDTIRIMNGSASNIEGSRIRVCAMMVTYLLTARGSDVLTSRVLEDRISTSLS